MNRFSGWLRMPPGHDFSAFSLISHSLMSIERAEQLKKELTDKWVVVNPGIPELRRFEELTGRVKTVNMNCRALVEFDGPEDIGWYDIDPGALTVVDAPKPKEKPSAAPKEKAAPAAGKAAAKPAAGGSPLDQIRAQGGGAAAAPAKPAAGGSPLDQIRAQGGGAAKPAAAPAKPAAGGSPLDQIRAQAAGGAAAPEAPAEPAAAAEAAPEEPAAAEPAEETPPPAPPAGDGVDTSGMSPLDAIRAMGAFKGDN